jgi:hypothetical protein
MKLTGRPWLLFSGHNYYPAGGADDFVAEFATEEDALEALKRIEPNHSGSWAHAVNVASGDRRSYLNKPTSRVYPCGWVRICNGPCRSPIERCFCEFIDEE